MYKQADKRINMIIDLIQKRNSNISGRRIREAYNYIKEKHVKHENGQEVPVRRKDASLYIEHPVEVALILARIGFDEEIIISALLHDVVEDTPVSIDEIRILFDNRIANMVDAVTQIDTDNSTIDKLKLDKLTDSKLFEACSKDPSALAIKLADRIHNLRTIDVFDEDKKMAKVQHTKTFLLALAEYFGMHALSRRLMNECFRIENVDMFSQIEKLMSHRDRIHEKEIETTMSKVKDVFNRQYKDNMLSNIRENIVHVSVKEMLPIDHRKSVATNMSESGAFYIDSEEEYRSVFILFKSDFEDFSLFSMFWQLFDYQLREDKIYVSKIIDMDSRAESYVRITDQWKNNYRVYLRTVDEHLMTKFGNTSLGCKIEVDEDNIGDALNETITVFRRNGEKMHLPKGSTVLDFAFYLHEQFGYGFQYAVVNQKAGMHCKPFTVLEDGDSVEVFASGTSNEAMDVECEMNIRWIVYCKTDRARNKLIHYMEQKLEL